MAQKGHGQGGGGEGTNKRFEKKQMRDAKEQRSTPVEKRDALKENSNPSREIIEYD